MEHVRTVVFSAHADDAALSCGGGLLLGVHPGPYALVTAFSESDFAPGLPNRLTREEVTRRRRAEDAAFCERIGASGVRLGLPEPPLRGYDRFSSIFDAGADPLRDSLFPKVRELVDAAAGLFPEAELLLAPLGLGHHIDHLLVREAVREAARDRSLPPAFYEDLPYASEYTTDEIRDFALAVDGGLRPRDFDLSEVMEAKLRLIEIYASQEVPHFVRSVLAHGRRLAEPGPGWKERLWISP